MEEEGFFFWREGLSGWRKEDGIFLRELEIVQKWAGEEEGVVVEQGSRERLSLRGREEFPYCGGGLFSWKEMDWVEAREERGIVLWRWEEEKENKVGKKEICY